MNYNKITTYVESQGYEILEEEKVVQVNLTIGGKSVILLHKKVHVFSELPRFFLLNPWSYGVLAHVMTSEELDLGGICVTENDFISINYDCEHLVFLESLQRHIRLLERAITDSEWNKTELLREFSSNWARICSKKGKELVCASKSGELEELKVYSPIEGRDYGIDSKYIGLSDSLHNISEFSYISRSAKSNKRKTSKGIGFILPLKELTPAPQRKGDIGQWFINAIDSLDGNEKTQLFNVYATRKTRECWIVFNGDTPSGKAWFGIHLSHKGGGKKSIPTTAEKLVDWNIHGVEVILFNKDLIMPRSGGNIALSEKNVLLIGCGSVGSEVAHKLACAGVGHMVLYDPDIFTIHNLYRHTLPEHWLGSNKAAALCLDMGWKYPWLNCSWSGDKLLDIDLTMISKADLIVIAIGSPTHERMFHDKLYNNGIKTPVIYSWLEGYGVGGHAILDIPNSKGCMKCAYVDLNTLGRGLSSNLNFIEENQITTVNHAGCGQLFLPYNALSSTQTALLACDLAVKNLLGFTLESVKVSWKGDARDALREGITLTNRYEYFTKSLQQLPLFNEDCDYCRGA